MRCHHPMPLKQENGESFPVPCGRCMPCRVNRSQEWALRIESEMDSAKNAHFLTLTYDEENAPRNDLGHTILHKSDAQKFLKRLRYHADQFYKVQMESLGFNQTIKIPRIRYFFIGEYGEETFRAHYHAITFNVPTETIKYIERIWGQGFVKIGTVTPQSIRYVTKYITKVDTRDLELRDLTKPFTLVSQGMGANYVNEETRAYHSRRDSLYTINKKYKQRIGKYLENKIHETEEQKKEVRARKKHNALKAEIAQRKEETELREKGVDLYHHYKEKQESETRVFHKNHKRKKL